MEARVKYPRQHLLLAKGSGDCVELGEVSGAISRVRACVPVSELFRHTLIVGATGSGKTRTASLILNRLVSGGYNVGVLVLDWHGEYGALLDSARVLDPFENPIGISGDTAEEVLEFLSQVLELTPPQEYVLAKSLERLKSWPPSMSKVAALVESTDDESAWFRESRLALLRKINKVSRGRYSRLFEPSPDLAAIKHEEPAVVNLSKIRDPDTRKIYAAALMKKVFDLALEGRFRDRPLIVVVEEAKNVLGKDSHVGVLVKMLGEVRKFNVGLIIIAQSPSSLVEDVMANTSVKIIHSIQSAVDVEVLSKATHLPHELVELLPYLERGEAVLSTSCYKKPVLVKIG